MKIEKLVKDVSGNLVKNYFVSVNDVGLLNTVSCCLPLAIETFQYLLHGPYYQIEVWKQIQKKMKSSATTDPCENTFLPLSN